MKRSRNRVFGSVAAAVLVAEAVVAVVHTATAPGLTAAGGLDYCYGPPTPADRSALTTVGLTFGVDALTLDNDTPVRVTSVTPVDAQGGVRLLRADVVPGGGEVGAGTSPLRGLPVTYPALGALARQVPATLVPTARPGSVVDPRWNPRTWQLVVTVSASSEAQDARTLGFVVTYRSRGERKTLRTRDSVRLTGARDGCGS